MLKQTPSELAQHRLELADNYGKLGELKVALLRVHSLYYEQYRPNYKSDAGLERAWENTNEGLELLEIKEKMRSIEHKLSAINSLLRVRENESYNQY
jgi:hypothetical protein